MMDGWPFMCTGVPCLLFLVSIHSCLSSVQLAQRVFFWVVLWVFRDARVVKLNCFFGSAFHLLACIFFSCGVFLSHRKQFCIKTCLNYQDLDHVSTMLMLSFSNYAAPGENLSSLCKVLSRILQTTFNIFLH